MKTVNPQKALQVIPGVGKSIANDLWMMGIREVSDLRGKDPELMYEQFCELVNAKVDICMVYVFRCAVYYATVPHPEPEKLNWWWWKGQKLDDNL